MASTKPQDKTNKLLIALGGAAALAAVLIAFHLLGWALATQKKLSCHTPKSVTTSTEYCVYYTAPGFLGGNGAILVGPSAGRGIVYGVPYQAHEIKVGWDGNNDAVSLHMPGTTLTVSAEEFIDTR